VKTFIATQVESDYYTVESNGSPVAGVRFDTLNQSFITSGHVVFVQTLDGDVIRYN
jgi:hypothetical protein